VDSKGSPRRLVETFSDPMLDIYYGWFGRRDKAAGRGSVPVLGALAVDHIARLHSPEIAHKTNTMTQPIFLHYFMMTDEHVVLVCITRWVKSTV
jgi:hypothetical protein